MKYIVFLTCVTLVGCIPQNTDNVESNSQVAAKEIERQSITDQVNSAPVVLESLFSKNTIYFDFSKLPLNNDSQQELWLNKNNMYKKWVRSFYDSDNDGNGDLKGVIEKLAYIKSLNVTTILLSPIFEAPSYHGYDVTDFLSINSTLGTEDDFDLLVEKAHELGLRIVLDLPINHTSDQHPWFKRSLNNDETYSDYYVWNSELPKGYGLPWDDSPNELAVWHSRKGKAGYFYGVFGYANPDLNYKNPQVLNEIKFVLAHWINKGADGFRIDAARYLIEDGPGEQADTYRNHQVISELIGYAKSVDSGTFFIGETFTDMNTSKQYLENNWLDVNNVLNQFDALFNFEFSSSIRDLYSLEAIENYHRDDNNSILKSSVFDIYTRISLNTPSNKSLYVFLNNHDIRRFAPPSIDEHFIEQYQHNINKIISTLTILSPFNLTVYYGEELGLQQIDSWEHEYIRGLMAWSDSTNLGFNNGAVPWMDSSSWFPWKEKHIAWSNDIGQQTNVELQSNDNSSLLKHYQKLLQLKKTDEVFSKPTRLVVHPANNYIWFIEYQIQKENSIESRWLVTNLSPDINTLLEIPDYLKGQYIDLYTEKEIELELILSVNAGQTLILKRN